MRYEKDSGILVEIMLRTNLIVSQNSQKVDNNQVRLVLTLLLLISGCLTPQVKNHLGQQHPRDNNVWVEMWTDEKDTRHYELVKDNPELSPEYINDMPVNTITEEDKQILDTTYNEIYPAKE